MWAVETIMDVQVAWGLLVLLEEEEVVEVGVLPRVVAIKARIYQCIKLYRVSIYINYLQRN
jgi:hypothetical protein